MKTVNELSPELLLNILVFLKPISVLTTSTAVCKSWNKLIFSKEFWGAHKQAVQEYENKQTRFYKHLQALSFLGPFKSVTQNEIDAFKHVAMNLKNFRIIPDTETIPFVVHKNLEKNPLMQVDLPVIQYNRLIYIPVFISTEKEFVHPVTMKNTLHVFYLLDSDNRVVRRTEMENAAQSVYFNCQLSEITWHGSTSRHTTPFNLQLHKDLFDAMKAPENIRDLILTLLRVLYTSVALAEDVELGLMFYSYSRSIAFAVERYEKSFDLGRLIPLAEQSGRKNLAQQLRNMGFTYTPPVHRYTGWYR